MQTKDEALKNAPAYPLHPYAASDMSGRSGLTKRELFAAHILSGMNSSLVEDTAWPSGAAATQMAIAAVSQADALIKALDDESDQG